MLRRLDLRGAGEAGLRAVLPRPTLGGDEPLAVVRAILAEVRTGGDAAVRRCTEHFDGVAIGALAVEPSGCDEALEAVEPRLRAAMAVALENVTAYHRAQLVDQEVFERRGMSVRALRRPVERAGVYVPGGRAAYPSTVLMTAVPARVAGVDEVVVCTPPGPDGSPSPLVLAAAALAEVDEVFRIGGAQAVGAMAYGTESVRPVDVIAGPGNVYVSLAKREVAGIVGVPSSFAGPSEVVVVADASVPTAWAAVDIVVQAEHGPYGLAWLVTWDEAVADAVTEEVARLVADSPRRSDLEATLGDGGYAVVCDGPEQAIAVSNAIAPEHLELLVDDPEALVPLVRHAGAVFCGPWAPASVGDYVAGPSHTLPTFGSARFASGLRVDDFTTHVHVVTLDEAALCSLAPSVAAFADAEGLPAHALSVRLRTEG